MLFLAALLLAQTAPACAATDADLPAILAGWKTPSAAAADPTLTLGQGALLLVAGPPKVTAGTETHSWASATFRVERTGVYSVALDQKGWIDVTPAGESEGLKSVSHREGGACWSIRKIVRFQLSPGAYRLTVKDPLRDPVKVLVVEGE